MPQFSNSSLNKLATCHPELQLLFEEVIKYRDCTVTEGFRDKEAQEAAFAHGASQKHWPNGNHNKVPSMAVDVYPYPIPGEKQTGAYYYFAGYVMCVADELRRSGIMKYKVRYGGDWDSDVDLYDQKLNDLVHFELVDP